MLAILSPSKSLDYDTPAPTDAHTQPALLDESQRLVDLLRAYDVDGLRDLMGISEDLALLNIERYDRFAPPFDLTNARQAILAFDGDVYRDFALDAYTDDDFAFLQRHVRILSGLYGLLRPLDLMQPYRLEMGTKLDNPRGDRLYKFWGDQITDQLNAALDAQGDPILLNLASNEYFKAVNKRKLAGRILNVNFKDLRNGSYKSISFYLKRLRGTMTNWIVQNGVEDPEALKGFDGHGYYFSDEHSTDDEYVFLRDEKP